MRLQDELVKLAKGAQAACAPMREATAAVKNKALCSMSEEILRRKAVILKANLKDLAAARRRSLSPALIDRLILDGGRVRAMADCLREVAGLADPVGEVVKEIRRPNGLLIKKVRVPIGVIAIIYESRPNVAADCIGLCFKSGNSVILRGGSEAMHSSLAITRILQGVIRHNRLPAGLINIVATPRRQAVDILLKLDDYIDLVIPRGGEGLIRKVESLSRIPVIKHYKGVCHTYVDEWADLNMAQKICFNAKVQRPGVCNAMESMLVHRKAAARFLPGMLREFKAAGVKVRGCPLTYRISRGAVLMARDKDYYTEYLGLALSVKVVDNVDAAIRHINLYGTHHSDTIVSENG
ncbi:MAG: glutamate-5-semialdehyde dehydrogenase, partial [Omnitrophica WOR_2 bacterium RIFCSPLOWO2_12_FULL_51_8]